MALDGRLGQKKDGERKKGSPDRDDDFLVVLLHRRDMLDGLLADMEKEVGRAVKKHPLWNGFLRDVKGVGPMMAAVLISEIDIHKATTVSKIWQFAGMNPGQVHGKVWKKVGGERTLVAKEAFVRGDKKTKGYVCPFNAFLKTKLLGVLGGAFLKAHSPYADLYYDERHRLESMNWGEDSPHPTDPAKPKANHQHRAANRKMVKLFLRDLYVAWRTIEGLEVRPPYAEEFLNKRHVG